MNSVTRVLTVVALASLLTLTVATFLFWGYPSPDDWCILVRAGGTGCSGLLWFTPKPLEYAIIGGCFAGYCAFAYWDETKRIRR